MRRVVLVGLVIVASCVHEERSSPPARVVETAVAPTPPPREDYVVAEPVSPKGSVFALGGNAYGVLADHVRAIVAPGSTRISRVATDAQLAGAERVPARMGGGFVFWTETALYRAPTWDGPLDAVAALPNAIARVSFAPNFVFLHSTSGERWGITLPKGARAPITPLGIADVEALDDGRALGWTDRGTILASLDSGAHWNDMTADAHGTPAGVDAIDGELWLTDQTGAAHRLERDGSLTTFDKAPEEHAPQLRAVDPRWRGQETPLRAAFHSGAAIDEATALVFQSGDLFRIDVHTGEIASVIVGRLPPDAVCEAVPAAQDILLVCANPAAGAGSDVSFVVAHTLTADPTIERSFTPRGLFYASDDGGLAYDGPCAGSTTPQASASKAACVRQPGGAWQEVDLSGLQADGGVAAVSALRWVPRADGRAVAIVAEPQPSLYDPRTTSLVPLVPADRDLLELHGGRPQPKRVARRGAPRVDSSWTAAGAGYRAWSHEGSFEVAEDGRVTRSPYVFELLSAGSVALGRTHDGRLFQSVDHGASFREIAAPPSAGKRASYPMRSCTTAGCDLGTFYRVGFTARPPEADEKATPAPPAPTLTPARGVDLACKPTGPVSARSLPRTDGSPEDLGLGMNRLPLAPESGKITYVRDVEARALANPLHDSSSSDADHPSLRAVLSGFATTRDGDVLQVEGPNRSLAQLRRQVTYVLPFDVAAQLHKTQIAVSDLLASGRAGGMSNEELFAEDLCESATAVPITPQDPGAAGDLVLRNLQGLLVSMRGERTRALLRPVQDEAQVISGVATGPDETTYLEVQSGGVERVFRQTASSMVELFAVNPGTSDDTFYPANPDALAIGPKGILGVVRLPSGAEPASALDPAQLVLQGGAPVELAPWAELKLVDDPACKADASGYRTTVQTLGSWIRITTPELREQSGPMFARVRWSSDRVCLEAVELPLASVSIRTGRDGDGTYPTYLVGRGMSFARVLVGEGVEWRQPMECALAR